jgi:hypothetical protein
VRAYVVSIQVLAEIEVMAEDECAAESEALDILGSDIHGYAQVTGVEAGEDCDEEEGEEEA